MPALEHDGRQLRWCAHRNAAARNVSKTKRLLFSEMLLLLCYMAVEAPPNRAQPCGPSIWFLDVSLICDIDLTWRCSSFGLHSQASDVHRVLCTVPRAMLSPPRDVLQLKLRPFLPKPHGHSVTRLRVDACGP